MDFREKVARLNASLNKLYSYKDEFVRLREKEKDLPPEEWVKGETSAFVDKYLDPIIFDTLQDLKEVALFFCDLEKEIKNTYIKQILSDREDLSDVTDEEVEKYYNIIQDDRLYKIFLEEKIPEVLKEFGISHEDYDQIKNESEQEAEGIKTSLDDIFRKAILEPDLDNPEARQAFFNRIVNEMIEEDKNCLEKPQSEDNNLKFNPDLNITEKLLNKDPDNQLK